MENKIELTRELHRRRFRKSQYKVGALALAYALLPLVFGNRLFFSYCAMVLGTVCAVIEFIITKISHMNSSELMEFDRLLNKFFN